MDFAPDKKDVDILFADAWVSRVSELIQSTPTPSATAIKMSRACIYIDWDNIQVASRYIPMFIKGISRFIRSKKAHDKYNFYVFLHNKIPTCIRQIFRNNKSIIVNIIKDKTKSADDEMFQFIRQNTTSGDSLCIVSGDRDFSAPMVDYVRRLHDVFLIYNTQALDTFKNNTHWLGSIGVEKIKGIRFSSMVKPQRTPQNKQQNTKPCKFWNLSICAKINCSFLHVCGVCGMNHKSKRFPPPRKNYEEGDM